MIPNRLHLLLVEDEEAHAELIRRAFETHSKEVSLTIVASLQEAQQYIAGSVPDLIIADLHLPDGQGVQLLPADKEAAPFPVIIMTSYGDEQVAVDMMKAGAVDYVVKSEAALAAMPRIVERGLREWGHIVERRQAQEETRRRNRELLLLNQVIAASVTSLEAPTILDKVCRELARGFDLPYTAALLLNDKQTGLTVIAEYLGEGAVPRLHSTLPLVDAATFQYLLKNKAPLVVSDARHDPELASIRERLIHYGTMSLLSLPLLIDNELVGSLELETFSPRSFSAEEVGLAWNVADQVAGALARVRLDEERRRLEKQYHQAQKMEAVGLLAAGIAHDFNNLLTAINGFAELMQRQLSPTHPHQKYISNILQSGQRAADLVRQLLAFSRKQIIKPKVLNLNNNVFTMEKMLRRIIGENIDLKTKLDPDLWPVKVDPAQVEQIIVNLAVNARDVMPEGGQLTLETANVTLDNGQAVRQLGLEPGEYVLLVVSDTGWGMTEEVKSHIFEPFFTTKEMGKGTGLGLATIFGIVKQSEGDIQVDSAPGQGTTFRIYFPRVTETVQPLIEPVNNGILPKGTETILLVEDEEAVRKLAVNLLRQQGYSVLEAANGQAAFDLVQAQNPLPDIKLLITDVVMPKMGGKALADHL
ncbi:MAG: response regulator, partial [Chloroflexota bacterium]